MMTRLHSYATTSPLEPSAVTTIGIFFVALATLMSEILLTRIFSATMGSHFAFVRPRYAADLAGVARGSVSTWSISTAFWCGWLCGVAAFVAFRRAAALRYTFGLLR
jgi:hypothetical protein